MNMPLIIAHRGVSTLAPENTMAAFRLAKDLGAAGIELDVMLSADERLVVIHDESVSRTTNGEGKVKEMGWNQLKSLDAGYKFDSHFTGEPLPLLDQVFEELGGKLLINVELKNYATPRDQLTEKVIDLILKMGFSESVILSSFNARNLLKAESLEPSIYRGLLTLPGLPGIPYRGRLGKRYHYDALHPYHKDVNARLVDRLHSEGKKVNVWTVDQAKDLLRMRDLGVDMVICNDPAHAREVIEAA
jgi:glycerophosphoryl diester phosphodiesterase